MMWSTDVVRTGDYSLRLEYRDNDCGQDDCPRGDFPHLSAIMMSPSK